MQELVTVILAAGAGTRMKSIDAKVTHKLCGQSMLNYVVDAAQATGTGSIVFVLGHQADQVKQIIPQHTDWVMQENQMGTGHAVMQARPILEKKTDHVLVLCGDTPLITGETLKNAYQTHLENSNQVTVLTTRVTDPTGYGRIIRDERQQVQAIIEHKDASPEQRAITEINSGMYFFEIPALLDALNELDTDNSQGEYYLTDTISKIIRKNGRTGAFIVVDSNEILGVNDRVQLAEAEKLMSDRIIKEHMRNGVTFLRPETSLIDANIAIGRDTVIYPGTILEAGTVIGEGCIIGPNAHIINSKTGNSVHVNKSTIVESEVGSHTKIGPYAYIRPDSKIGEHVKIGDFVEIKKSRINNHTKVPHLTYIGDAEIGKHVNMGCGVVVVNYDGVKKHKTIVGDHAFVGCNVNLVSPVEVKPNAYIAAGSTITEEVPEYALAIARSRQTIIENWVKKKGLDKK